MKISLQDPHCLWVNFKVLLRHLFLKQFICPDTNMQDSVLDFFAVKGFTMMDEMYVLVVNRSASFSLIMREPSIFIAN